MIDVFYDVDYIKPFNRDESHYSHYYKYCLIKPVGNFTHYNIATNIDKDTNISGNIEFEELNDDIEPWVKHMEKMAFKRDFEVEKHIIDKEYNIKNVAKLMQKIYLNGEQNENII